MEAFPWRPANSTTEAQVNVNIVVTCLISSFCRSFRQHLNQCQQCDRAAPSCLRALHSGSASANRGSSSSHGDIPWQLRVGSVVGHVQPSRGERGVREQVFPAKRHTCKFSVSLVYKRFMYRRERFGKALACYRPTDE